ncbi:MAG: acyl-CoA desaturase [Phycisphaeraceae bacterium]|nr:acyl-CoA desaturase [Phycisphaerales bacterium]MCB9860382.1 acyl-CoA desaturase [Phycisphaeraceae bacterium]
MSDTLPQTARIIGQQPSTSLHGKLKLKEQIAAHLPEDENLDLPVGLPLGRRIANLIVILVPLAALIVACVYAWGWGLGWTELGLFFGMYLLTGFGVTIGYHRLFAHKSFSTGPIMTSILAILGTMSVQGSLLRWVSFHRGHHQHSDQELDPHSPHGHGDGIIGAIKGAWNAHLGWMFKPQKFNLDKYVPDLRRSKLIRTISALSLLWVVLSLAIPTVLGGLIDLSWRGAFLGLLWGGLIRIAFVHHVTWSVNSVCHMWGTRPYKSHDESRNNPIVGVLALGEGWHNNHHAFPTSARHGLAWWQIDFSYIIIWCMAKMGLVWNVRVPDAERQAKQRR